MVSIDEDVPPMGKLFSVPIADITGDYPIKKGTAPLPPQLQGVFWLTAQSTGSALMSFGGPSGHPVLNTGTLDEDGTCFISLGRYQKWSFASQEDGNCKKSANPANDLVYEFNFDDAEDPQFCSIVLHSGDKACDDKLQATVWKCLNFDMYLVEDEDYPGSIVWSRRSYCCGIDTCFSYVYKIVQVIDGQGNKIQPAYDEFEEYVSEYANPPGTIQLVGPCTGVE
jgi:hypothetical protein